MEIEWDNNKAASNLIKHKIDFEDAKNIFLDPNRLEREDKRDYDEARIQVIGIVNQVVLWLFVTLYAKLTDKMPRQHTSNPKIPKVSKAIGSPFY
jgi:uncharacterized DUF497 family protein